LHNSPYIHFFSSFGLRENPFAVSPDPRYLFMTRQVQEAWDALAYGIRSREGIILLTGEAGTGKTSVIHRVLEWLHERRMPTAFIFNSHLEPKHLYDFMLADFGVRPDPRWEGNALMCLGQWLTERCREGQIPVLIVDEAQGLSLQVLEEIRLLLNLETPHQKLLQIVLVGQPEFEEKLNRPEMRQLKQRIALRCRTEALSLKETHDYVQARLNIAGAAGKPIFSPDALNAVHAYSRGIPRVMNLLCEHALINAYAGNMRVVPARVLDEVAREFQFDQEKHVPSIRTRFTELPSRPHQQLASPESLLPDVHAAPAPVTSPPETSAPLSFSAPVEPVLATAAHHQSGVALPDRTEVVHTPHQSDASSAPERPLIVRETSNRVATGATQVKVSLSHRIIAKLPSRRPTALSRIVRSELVEKGRDFREGLRHARQHLFDKRILRRITATASSGVIRVARRLSAVCSGAERSSQLLWRDAGPVWQRMRGTLLHWLDQPLSLRFPSTTRKSHTTLSPKPVSSLELHRSWQSSLERFESIVLPARQMRVNVIVLQWLRQPFRPPQSLHPNPRATAPRKRLAL
jgi:general secretion pathway protein A